MEECMSWSTGRKAQDGFPQGTSHSHYSRQLRMPTLGLQKPTCQESIMGWAQGTLAFPVE